MKNIIKNLMNDYGVFKITSRKPGKFGCEVTIRYSRHEARQMHESLSGKGLNVQLSQKLPGGQWRRIEG